MLHTAWLVFVTIGSFCGLALALWASAIRVQEWHTQRKHQRLVTETRTQDDYLRFIASEGTRQS